MHITATWFPLWHHLLSFVILVILVNLEIRDALSWSYFFLLHSATTSVSWVLVFQVWLVVYIWSTILVLWDRSHVLSQAEVSNKYYDRSQGKLKRGMSDDDVTIRPWLPFKKMGDLFVLNSYIDIKMLRIYLSPQIYHHHQHFWCKI